MNRILGYVSISLFNWIMVSAYGHEALHPMMDPGFQKALASYYFGLEDDKKMLMKACFLEEGNEPASDCLKWLTRSGTST